MDIWIPVIVACVAAVGSAVTILVQFFINRKDSKEDKFKNIEQEFLEINKKLDGFIAITEKAWEQDTVNKMWDRRRRIMSFASDIRMNKLKKSGEQWRDIIFDINLYKEYCDAHPDFANNVAVESISFIEEAMSNKVEN